MSERDLKSSFHSLSVEQVIERMDVEPQLGLGEREIQHRVEKHGPNKLREAKPRSVWEIIIEQFKSMVIVVTISFLTLAFGKLWFVLNLRRPGTSIFNNDIVKNPFVGGSIVLCVLLLLAAVYLPGISELLKTVNPTRSGWLVLIGMSLVPFVFGQLLRIIQKVRGS